jgi:hypothetical protein
MLVVTDILYVRKANKIFLNYNFSTSQALAKNLGNVHVLLVSSRILLRN